MNEPSSEPGYAVSSLGQMGEGPGFRKVRQELGVTAFGGRRARSLLAGPLPLHTTSGWMPRKPLPF